MKWEHRDPSDASYRTTIITGGLDAGGELDPVGADVTSDPIIYGPNPEEGNGSLLPYPSFSNPTQPGLSYRQDGIPVSTDYFMMQLQSAEFDPLFRIMPRASNARHIVIFGTC